MSYPLIRTRTYLWVYAYLGEELLVFWKIWRALISCNIHFEIHPFALLPANCKVFVDTVSSKWNGKSQRDIYSEQYECFNNYRNLLLIDENSLIKLSFIHSFIHSTTVLETVGNFPMKRLWISPLLLTLKASFWCLYC